MASDRGTPRVGVVTIIKINAITVPADSGDELAKRFAARAGAVDGADGFEGFELLRPTDDRATWLVVTRWRDEAAFEGWRSSAAFAHGHQGANAPDPQTQRPVSTGAELWNYEVVTL
jgi:heme oxygenase (mycobilin-producing)